MNLKLDLKPETILPLLKRARPYLIGGVLVGIFVYTAYTVNTAINVTPASVTETATTISFDKPTIQLLKSLDDVSGAVPATTTGSANPFAR